jgi:hypothetical protein
MIKIYSLGNYDYYLGFENGKEFYNIVPINSEPPNSGYYNSRYISKIKNVKNIFEK